MLPAPRGWTWDLGKQLRAGPVLWDGGGDTCVLLLRGSRSLGWALGGGSGTVPASPRLRKEEGFGEPAPLVLQVSGPRSGLWHGLPQFPSLGANVVSRPPARRLRWLLGGLTG